MPWRSTPITGSPSVWPLRFRAHHVNVLHLLANLYWLWIFGEHVEDRLGRARFVLLFVLSALAAALAQGAFMTTPDARLLGASGAISGVAACFAVEFPRARIGRWFVLPWSWSVVPL